MYKISNMNERRTSDASRAETQRALRAEEELELFLEDIGVTDWARILKRDAEDLVARLFGEKE